MIGYCTLEIDTVKDFVEKELKSDAENKPTWYSSNWSDYFYHNQELYKNADLIVGRARDYGSRDNSNKFFKLLEALKENSQKIQVFHIDEVAAIIGYSKNKFILPSSLINYSPLPDYTMLTGAAIQAIGHTEAGPQQLPANMTGSSIKSTTEEIKEKQAEIEIEEKKCKDEIEVLRQELRKKEEQMMKELEEKTRELYTKKDELEKQLFVLETQIYSIRCYLGEVIDFVPLRTGQAPPDDTPMILYQKIRYLDEELGKTLMLYNYSASDHIMDVLRYRDDIRDFFCPAERCICVLQSSRTGKTAGGHKVIANMLTDYEYLHGKQLAILIRNGENLYIGWTDDEMILLSDEDLFLKTKTEYTVYKDPESLGLWEKKQQEQAERKMLNERISRWYLIKLMQGIIDNSELIKFPEHFDITKENEYIQFSFAEGWLKDTRFGTLTDILDKSKDIPVKVGETVLTAMTITRDDRSSIWGRNTMYDAYNNDRGIGDKNRTHGASIPSMEFLPINKVLRSGTAVAEFTKHKPVLSVDGSRSFTYADETGDRKCYNILSGDTLDEVVTIKIHLNEDDFSKSNNVMAAIKNKYSDHMLWFEDKEKESGYGMYRSYQIRKPDSDTFELCFYPEFTSADFKESNRKTYISVPMERYYGSDSTSRCNFQIVEDEYIRTTFLCSTWLKYVITTGNIGSFSLCGHRFSYADALKYLNTLLPEIVKREEKEKELLESDDELKKWVEETPEWDRILCEWRIENQFYSLNKRNVGKFKKYIVH